MESTRSGMALCCVGIPCARANFKSIKLLEVPELTSTSRLTFCMAGCADKAEHGEGPPVGLHKRPCGEVRALHAKMKGGKSTHPRPFSHGQSIAQSRCGLGLPQAGQSKMLRLSIIETETPAWHQAFSPLAFQLMLTRMGLSCGVGTGHLLVGAVKTGMVWRVTLLSWQRSDRQLSSLMHRLIKVSRLAGGFS